MAKSPSYLWKICSRHPNRCPKVKIMSNLIYTLCCFLYIPVTKLNSFGRSSQKLTIAKSKIEQFWQEAVVKLPALLLCFTIIIKWHVPWHLQRLPGGSEADTQYITNRLCSIRKAWQLGKQGLPFQVPSVRGDWTNCQYQNISFETAKVILWGSWPCSMGPVCTWCKEQRQAANIPAVCLLLNNLGSCPEPSFFMVNNSYSCMTLNDLVYLVSLKEKQATQTTAKQTKRAHEILTLWWASQ